mgnify:CR=1 FL=1
MLLVDGSTLPPVVTLWRNRTTTSTPMAYQFDYTFTAFSVPKHQNIGICLHFKHRTFCRVVRDRLSGGNRTPRTNCPVSKRYITNLIMYRFDTSPPGWCIVLIHPIGGRYCTFEIGYVQDVISKFRARGIITPIFRVLGDFFKKRKFPPKIISPVKFPTDRGTCYLIRGIIAENTN